jgi:hypothetical protein
MMGNIEDPKLKAREIEPEYFLLPSLATGL